MRALGALSFALNTVAVLGGIVIGVVPRLSGLAPHHMLVRQADTSFGQVNLREALALRV